MNNYVEIVTDENGETHFKDVTLVFDAVDIAPPAAPMNVSPFIPAKDVAVIHLQVDGQGGIQRQAWDMCSCYPDSCLSKSQMAK